MYDTVFSACLNKKYTITLQKKIMDGIQFYCFPFHKDQVLFSRFRGNVLTQNKKLGQI